MYERAYKAVEQLLQKRRGLAKTLLFLFNHLFFKNRLCAGRTNELACEGGILFGLRLNIRGKNNRIIVEDLAVLKNCRVNIYGDGNTVRIGKRAKLNTVELYFEDDGNEITIGADTLMCGNAHLAAIEGTRIGIGDGCLFSSGTELRTGDSHSIVDENGARQNPSRGISVGEHVWFGVRVTCLKGVSVADNCVVAATSTLSGRYDEPGCIIGGVPARVLKKNINWLYDRI